MKYLPLYLLVCVASAGCSVSPAPDVRSDRSAKSDQRGSIQPPLITAAYVEVGPRHVPTQRASFSRATLAPGQGWITKAADGLGLVVYDIGTWQQLPRADKYSLLMTQREIVTCQVCEIRPDGQVVVEASTYAANSAQRVTLGPGARQEAFIHLSGEDAVAIRLGWEDPPPPPVFARALLVYTRPGLHEGWPADLSSSVVKDLSGILHGVGARELGSGRWVPLGPDLTQVGLSPEKGEILAGIYAREWNGYAQVMAVLPKVLDAQGRPLSHPVSVWRMNNPTDAAICTPFEHADDQDSYIAVIFHCGPVTGTPKGTVSGRVFLDSRPVNQARVIVYSRGEVPKPVAEGLTAQDGRFAIGLLPTDAQMEIVITKSLPGSQLIDRKGLFIKIPSGHPSLQVGDVIVGAMPPPINWSGPTTTPARIAN